MTAPSSIDPARFLDEQLAQASPDLLRQMLTTFINTLMSTEADAVCGAEYGVRTAERVNTRNGYRTREFDTRAGTLDLAIPKLRAGSYFPDWLLEPRRRAERALTTVVATCYLLGVSTRRMEKLVESLGITRLSKSQVSKMARDLDEQVAAFRHRPLDQGPYTFVAADALVLKVREGGRVVNVHALVATGVNGDGHREILGLQVTSAEDGAGWLAFFRDLTARGLTGVALVTSDAHRGLVDAVGAAVPGAAWQRCRTHWACKESSCRRVGDSAGCPDGGQQRGRSGESLFGRQGDVSVLLKNHRDFAGCGAQGAPADLEQLGECLVAAEASLVEHGGQHAFGVGELLGEDAAAGAGQSLSAAAAVAVPLVAGGQDGKDALGHRGQFGAGHAGQRGVGEQFSQAQASRLLAAA
jgi:Transposase, Mutator family